MVFRSHHFYFREFALVSTSRSQERGQTSSSIDFRGWMMPEPRRHCRQRPRFAGKAGGVPASSNCACRGGVSERPIKESTTSLLRMASRSIDRHSSSSRTTRASPHPPPSPFSAPQPLRKNRNSQVWPAPTKFIELNRAPADSALATSSRARQPARADVTAVGKGARCGFEMNSRR